MSRLLFAFCIALGCASLPEANAQVATKREPAGRLVTEDATVLARETPASLWRPLMQNQEIPSQDLLIGLNDAYIESLNKAIQVRTVTDLTNHSPLPIIETAIRLNPPKDADLDLTLERGRIDVTSLKAKTKVIIRFKNRVWTLTPEKAGTRFALEIYGRFPEGTRFNTRPNPEEPPVGPVTTVMMVVIKGEVQRACDRCTVAMAAPPGPAEFSWDSIYGDDASPKKLEKEPDWIKDFDPTTPEGKKRLAAREVFRKTVLTKGLGEAILMLLDSPDKEIRRVGVYALGAFDQISSLGRLITNSEDAETWNHAVIALRHWLGRGEGQDQFLFKRLIDRRGYSPAHAGLTIDMLMGFSREERARPELYSLLIDLLRHERLAIRGLAYWHLQRLAPNIKVAFNPLADKSEWEKSRAEYMKKIPSGKLPPSE